MCLLLTQVKLAPVPGRLRRARLVDVKIELPPRINSTRLTLVAAFHFHTTAPMAHASRVVLCAFFVLAATVMAVAALRLVRGCGELDSKGGTFRDAGYGNVDC